MAFGVSCAIFRFIIIAHLNSWRPDRLTLGSIAAAITIINIGGLYYPARHRREHPRWLIVTEILGNCLSLFVIVYAVLGMLYLEYVFRL